MHYMNGAGDDMEVDVPSIAASDRPGTIPTYTLQPGLVTSQADKSPLAYFSQVCHPIYVGGDCETNQAVQWAVQKLEYHLE